MSDHELHMEDHKRLMSALDCRTAVAALDKDISLLHLQIREMKADKEKANRTLTWVCGMAFSIIMAVAGSLISSSATVQVLEEKVAEQKAEINQVMQFVNQQSDDLVNHEH